MRGEEMKIIFADNDECLRKVFSQFITKRIKDSSVLLANDGDEALILFSENPDTRLIITDLNMPWVDGIELVEKVRLSSNVPIIVVSGELDKLERAMEVGASKTFRKPFNPNNLLEAIKDYLVT